MQLINDRCVELQRSKHGSRQHPEAVGRASGTMCSPGRSQKQSRDRGNGGNEGRADLASFLKSLTWGKRSFCFLVRI